MADGERTDYIADVARVKALTSKDDTLVDTGEKEAGEKGVIFITEGKNAQSNIRALKHKPTMITSDEAQMTPMASATAVGNVKNHQAHHSQIGDTNQCFGAHQSNIAQKLAAAHRQTKGGLCKPTIKFFTVERLITLLEKEYSMKLREITKGASSREQKGIVAEIWMKWRETAREDLEDACITNHCVTQCPEELDPKRYLPRYKQARENTGDLQQKTAKIETEKKKILSAWDEYYELLQTQEEPVPPKEVTRSEYVQARCLTLMTIMITMANENLLQESNICCTGTNIWADIECQQEASRA